MTSRRRAAVAAGVLIGVVLLGAAGWRFVRALPVGMATVDDGTVPVSVVGPASVQARVPITLAARVTAVVTGVAVDIGDHVEAGQLLATLDDRDLAARSAAVAAQRVAQQHGVGVAEATLQKAAAERALAESRRRRDADLQARGFVSAAGLDASQFALQAAEAAERTAAAALAARRAELTAGTHELAAADAARSHTRLHAPRAALVVQRLAEPGDTVVPGAPLLKLVDPASVWLAMQVDEAVLARVQPGQVAQIRLRNGVQLSGRVLRIARQADAATREVEVDVAFDQVPAAFAIDQQAEVSVHTGDARGLRLPVSALVHDRDGRTGVLAVIDGRTRFVPVQTGAGDGTHVLVQAEAPATLAAGATVVAPAAGVRAGMRVRPLGT